MPESALELRAMLDEGANTLRRAGLEEPRRQALRIWSDLNQSSGADALLGGATEIEPQAARRYRESIRRRSAGEPLAHVTGWTGFRHLLIRSDRRALIPRPETEGLVDLLLQRQRTGRVVDIGTGSGCIGLSLALEGEFERVLGLDRSAAALALAATNRRLTGARLELVRGDFCAALGDQSFDALISNPPYLTRDEYDHLDPAVRGWEPELALVSGDDGLEATACLLDEGRRVLRPGGWLILELDCTRTEVAARHASALGWEEPSVHPDLFGRERYLLARRSKRS